MEGWKKDVLGKKQEYDAAIKRFGTILDDALQTSFNTATMKWKFKCLTDEGFWLYRYGLIYYNNEKQFSCNGSFKCYITEDGIKHHEWDARSSNDNNTLSPSIIEKLNIALKNSESRSKNSIEPLGYE